MCVPMCQRLPGIEQMGRFSGVTQLRFLLELSLGLLFFVVCPPPPCYFLLRYIVPNPTTVAESEVCGVKSLLLLQMINGAARAAAGELFRAAQSRMN